MCGLVFCQLMAPVLTRKPGFATSCKNTSHYLDFKLLMTEVSITRRQTYQQELNESSDKFSPDIRKNQPHPDERIRNYDSVHLPEMVISPRPFRCNMAECNSTCEMCKVPNVPLGLQLTTVLVRISEMLIQ